MLTESARDSAFVFCITRPRCAFTVISLIPNPPATCLLIILFVEHPVDYQGHLFSSHP